MKEVGSVKLFWHKSCAETAGRNAEINEARQDSGDERAGAREGDNALLEGRT